MRRTINARIVMESVWVLLVGVALCSRPLHHHPSPGPHLNLTHVTTLRQAGGTLPPHRQGGGTLPPHRQGGGDHPSHRLGGGVNREHIIDDDSVLLRCPPCSKIHCEEHRPRRLRCAGGVTRGVCGCCPVCAKTRGQVCGGALGYLGRCDAGLTCHLREPVVWTYRASTSLTYYSRVSGVCVPGSEGGSPRLGWWQKAGDDDGQQQQQEALREVSLCQPPCTYHYCASHPNAVCSARLVGEEVVGCRGVCQHTVCRACRLVHAPATPPCPACPPEDWPCLRRYGRCVRRDYCTSRKIHCRNALYMSQASEGKYICQVPQCP
nr:uncharacterized protein LOC123757029 [Procambarus clarkii]XP_045596384.1 uncharacterized protein LOC123757029 [Procambarus clarkii]